MTKSRLTDVTMLSPNGYFPRSAPIRKVTVHHMAGHLTVEQCGEVFASSARGASSNYGVDSSGRIGCYVEEQNAAWTSSSYWNDSQAVTIEVANTEQGVSDGTWAVSGAAWDALVALCADVCKRYGITPTYTGGTDGTFTEHWMFAATGCPGPYIHSRMHKLVNDVKNAMEEDIDMATGQQIYDFLTDDSDPTGRGKKGNMKVRIAYMAQKQEKMQSDISHLNAKLDRILAMLENQKTSK